MSAAGSFADIAALAPAQTAVSANNGPTGDTQSGNAPGIGGEATGDTAGGTVAGATGGAGEGAADLFVSKLTPDTSMEELQKVFAQFGPVTDVRLPTDHFTDMPRGFAYVTFATVAARDAALQKPVKLRGNDLNVHVAFKKGAPARSLAAAAAGQAGNRRAGVKVNKKEGKRKRQRQRQPATLQPQRKPASI